MTKKALNSSISKESGPIFFRAIDFYPRISLRFGIVALICIFSAAAYVFLQPTFAKTRLHHFRFDWIDSVFLIRAT